MFKKIAETIIGGAIGALALYAVGKLAYQAGKEVAREECRYSAMQKSNNQQKSGEKEQEASVENEITPSDNLSLVPVEAVPKCAPKKRQSKLGLLFGARKMFGNRKSVIGSLVRNPEDHKFEAFIQGDELQIHVRRKGGLAKPD